MWKSTSLTLRAWPQSFSPRWLADACVSISARVGCRVEDAQPAAVEKRPSFSDDLIV
jgi:hypothetical protein